MRNRIYTIMLLLLMLAALADRLSAQTGASGDASVTADVVDGLTLTNVSDLDFGLVAVGAGAVAVAVTDAGAAELRLLAERGRGIAVTLTPPANLTDGSGNTIPYTWAASYHETANDPATSTAFATTTETIRPREVVSGNRRRAYIWLHGSITVGAVPTGTYSGTFTVTATY